MIQRYDLDVDWAYEDLGIAGMLPVADGDWVKLSDVLALLAPIEQKRIGQNSRSIDVERHYDNQVINDERARLRAALGAE